MLLLLLTLVLLYVGAAATVARPVGIAFARLVVEGCAQHCQKGPCSVLYDARVCTPSSHQVQQVHTAYRRRDVRVFFAAGAVRL